MYKSGKTTDLCGRVLDLGQDDSLVQSLIEDIIDFIKDMELFDDDISTEAQQGSIALGLHKTNKIYTSFGINGNLYGFTITVDHSGLKK